MPSQATRTTPEQLYRLLADNATDIVTLHDLSGRYLYVSPSVRTFGGYAPEDLIGRTCWELMHPDDIASVRQAMGAALGEGRIVTLEYRLRCAPGTFEWVETTARGVGDEIQCSSRHVTERREAQTELALRLAQQSTVARLGDLVMRRVELDVVFDAASRAVADMLDVELVKVVEHLGEGRMAVRGGVGWREGFVGSEFEMRSFSTDRGRRRYANGPVIFDLHEDDGAWRARPLREHGVLSSVNVLIGREDDPMGVLGANTRTKRSFARTDLDFLQSVAHVLASAIGRRRFEDQMRHDALHDALTGLPNRTLLLDRLGEALKRAEREAGRVAVLFLDLDNLKVLNDSSGHSAGDELLRAIGPRMRGELRASDTIARFGGDEFAIVCDDIADSDHAGRIAERLVKAFEDPFIVGGEERFASVSVGVVVTEPGRGRRPEELLSDADAAMYRAKARGRGRFELFDIGKLAVSNRILDKPGRLDDDEMAAMCEHPRYTHEILNRVACLRPIVDTAANHHERLDGKGYHRGLAAFDLTRPARILAAADVYEALTADRPYRDAMPRERALSILREMRGTALCPTAVDAIAVAAGDPPAWTADIALPTAARAPARSDPRRQGRPAREGGVQL